MADAVDDYIANFEAPMRGRLEAVRTLVHRLVPEATEKIAYQMPAFVYHGKNLIYVGGFKDHLGIFPGVVDNQFAAYQTGKGTLQFKNDKALPLDVIEQVIEVKQTIIDQ